MIPQTFIRDLLNRVDIVEVVGRHVRLKKSGANYSACCPFHSEKTPSFTVSPTKQFYHCFGCGAHGNAISFLMAHGGMGYVDAIGELASSLGLSVPRESGGAPEKKSPDLYEVMRQAAKHYRAELKKSPGAIEYLRGRGLSGEIAQRFHLGYAPAGWRGLSNAFPDYDSPLLVEAGLVIAEEGKRYDRFRDRVMFPIEDERGRIIAFGGRVLGEGEPKYLNSPETPLFEKGRELYGLFHARRSIHDGSTALVVEGYMDVVALAQHGIDFAVATLGTATTPVHVQKLFRHADHVVFSFDGDAAGRRAAWRAMENSLPILTDGKKVSFLFLPQGEDPDSFVRARGKDAFLEAMKEALPLSSFLVAGLEAKCGKESGEDRARLLHEAKPYLEKISAPGLSLVLRKSFAAAAGVDPSELDGLFGIKPSERKVSHRPRKGGHPSVVRKLLEMLMHSPSLATLVSGGCENFELPSVRKEEASALIGSLIFLQSGSFNTAELFEHFRGTAEGALLDEVTPGVFILDEAGLGEEEIQSEFLGAWNQLQSMVCRAEMDALLEKSRSGWSEADKSRYLELMQKLNFAKK